MLAFLAVVIGLGVLTRSAIDRGEAPGFKNLKEYDEYVASKLFGKKDDPKK